MALVDRVNTTLVLLVKKSDGKISDICLAYKKRGFGAGRWNGIGGKLKHPNETIEDAARREAAEEIGVKVNKLVKVAELNFIFPHHPTWNQLMYVFLADTWQGEPTESEEMKPQWFHVDEIPFASMWPDDKHWFPMFLEGKKFCGRFLFGDNDTIVEMDLSEME